MLKAHQNAARGVMVRPADRRSPMESGVISHLLRDYFAGLRWAEGCEPPPVPRASTRSEGRPASLAPRRGELLGLPGRAPGGRGAHVLRQPGAQRPGGPQEAGHPVMGGGGLQPALHRPLLPGDDPLVAEQADPRVFGGIAARGTLQEVTPADADVVLFDRGDDLLQLAAGAVAGHRLAVPVELVGRHAVHAVAAARPSAENWTYPLPTLAPMCVL